jgi:hypothetical protein
MAARDKLNWFLQNVEKAERMSEWIQEQEKEILRLETENERRRAVQRLIWDYRDYAARYRGEPI